MNIRNRLDKLEASSPQGWPVCVWMNHDETKAEVLARLRKDNPNVDERNVMFITWKPPQ